jgi:hypothetical protein
MEFAHAYPHLLIGLHAGLGELGALAFLWVLVELFNANSASIKRATRAALIGVVGLLLSWFVGGYYYLSHYQSDVKAVIKGGPQPWAHSIITETKEHVFFFLPFLGILVWGILKKYGDTLMQDRNTARSVMLLSGLIVLLAFSMAGMGYLISSGMRSALELKTL